MTRALQHLALFGLLALLIVAPQLSTPALARPDQPAEAIVNLPRPAAEPAVAEPSTAAAPVETEREPSAASPAEPASGPTRMVLAGGTVVSPETFYSASLDKTTWYEVILPPGYAQSTRRYPVLYMLHGAMGGANEWIEIGLHEAADRLWTEGALDHFIIVLPEGGQLTYWLNHADGGPRYSDLVVRDIVQEIDAAYRTIQHPDYRAVGGLSMGGDAALRLGLTHPDVFGVVGAHSPTTRLRYEDRPGPFYGDFGYWQQNNSLWLLKNTGNAPRLKISIDVGENDPWVFSARELHVALEQQGIAHQYLENPGSHEAEYWIAYQANYLRFYGRAFSGGVEIAAGEPADPPSEAVGE